MDSNTSADRRVFSSPKRILVVRLSSIGDIANCLPVACTLRLRFPRAEICWLVENDYAPILQGHWAINRLITVRKGWTKSPLEILRLRNRLKTLAPDCTFDLQGLFKSSFAAWLSGSKYRIGFGGPESREGSWIFNNLLVLPDQEHQVERNMQLLEPFGVAGSSVSFDIPCCETDKHNAENTIRRLGLDTNFAVLHIGASKKEKRWMSSRWANLAKYLLEQWNIPSLITWENSGEKVLAEKIVAKSNGSACLIHSVSLVSLISVIRNGTIFVGTDSGMLNIAAAVGVPTVGLFGPSLGERIGPYGNEKVIVQKKRPERKTLWGRLRSKEKTASYMESIETLDVITACDEILSIREQRERTILFPELQEYNSADTEMLRKVG
ncbi:MAG: glycosyltransferase family 9 protein [Thermoguttaceae bacterium]